MNKKLIMITVMVIAIISLSSKNSVAEEYKFESDNMSLEVQMNPPLPAFGLNGGVRARMFNSPNTAFRLGFNLSYFSEKEPITVLDSEFEMVTLESTESAFNLSLRPGYEVHLEGTDRLSPYYGGELVIALQRSAYTEEYLNDDDDIEEMTIRNGSMMGDGPSNRGFFGFGLNGVAGFDYYIAKNFYLGAEMAYGINFRSYSDITIEGDADEFDDIDDVEQGSSFSFAPSMNANLRIGIVF